MKSINELARILQIEEADFHALLNICHRQYRLRKEEKSGGGFRLIEAPFPSLKLIQKTICKRLLNDLRVHPALFGGRGTSQIGAARIHLQQPMVVTMDIRNFFPSVSSTMVKQALVRCGIGDEPAKAITKLATRNRKLPQGAPTSPVLARLVVSPVVERIVSALEKVSSDCRVTQYVDDLCISGPLGIERMIPTITRIWNSAGFSVHPSKTKIMSYLEEQEVLGVWLTDKLKPSPLFIRKLEKARRELPTGSASLRGLENWNSLVTRS